MADIYFYQVQLSEVMYSSSDQWSYLGLTKSLQQCDPEDETDGGSTLGGETNTQVYWLSLTKMCQLLNLMVTCRGMTDFIQLPNWRNLQQARISSIGRWLPGQFSRPCVRWTPPNCRRFSWSMFRWRWGR